MIMRDAKILLIPAVAAMALMLPACKGKPQPDENQVITDINAAEPGDIEALPPDESVDPGADNASTSEETGESESTENQG
jgi:hypothetical protein